MQRETAGNRTEDYLDQVVYRQQALVRELYEEMKVIRTIPCMKCSLRAGKDLTPRKLHFRIPLLAVNTTMEEAGPKGVVGKGAVRGRGRAALLRERAAKACSTSVPHSTSSRQGTSTSLVGSSTPSFRLGDSSENCSPSSSPVTRGCVTSSAQPWNSASEGPAHTPSGAHQPGSQFNGSLAPVDSALQTQANQPFDLQSEPDTNLLNTGSTKGKKVKYTRVDLREHYEQHQSELLVGIPAGAERGLFTASAGFNGFDQIRLGSEDTPCMFTGYRPQRAPKVDSISDFPSLCQQVPRPREEAITFEKDANKQESELSMTAIADSVLKGVVADVKPASKVTEVEVEEPGKGYMLVIENIPRAFDSRELVEPFGKICRITTEQTGKTYTATVTMKDREEAQWVSDSLGGAELVPGTTLLTIRVL